MIVLFEEQINKWSKINTHSSELWSQGGSTLQRAIDERTWVFYKNKPC